MKPRDIEGLVSIGRPSIAQDASFAVFATSRPDITANRNVGQVWRADLPAGRVRRLTRGVADTAPAVSPDGARVAFLRGDEQGHAQVFVVPAEGGEPTQATDEPLGVTAFAWAPEGGRLAFLARVAETGRYGTVSGLTAEAEPPRRITGVRWLADGVGYIADRPAHLFVIEAPGADEEPLYEPAPVAAEPLTGAPQRTLVRASARQLTHGAQGWRGLAWLPSGQELLTIPDAIEPRVRDLRDSVVAVRVADGEQREVLPTSAQLSVDEVVVAPDGQVFYLASAVGAEGRDFVAPGVGLWLPDGEGARALTDPETVDLGEVGSALTVHGAEVLVQDRTRGRVRLCRVSRDGELGQVLGGDVEVTGVAAAGARIVASVGSPGSFGDLVLIEDGVASTLTDFGAPLRACGIVSPREVVIRGRDGYPVHGWVATPPGEGPFPVLLQIHGGPYAAYGVRVFDETQVLVDAGYAVVYCNPRGSAGYGREHGRVIRGAMGTLDFADVMDFFDAATADPRLDAGRAGVLGGSYGGYLTAWIIAHEDRFAGAVVERGFLDPVSFRGTSDIGSYFGDEYVGTDPERIRAQSPMAVVDRVRTPTLVMHAERDHRCPLEQATRYYAALKRRGVDTEMLIFPGENHELSRSGQPQHRVQRFDALLEWWGRRLPVR